MSNPTPHKHATLIKQWADDTSQPVWGWNSVSNYWTLHPTPNWDENTVYAVGDKPTEPPRKMCNLAGVEFPMPETAVLATRTKFYLPCLKGGSEQDEWGDYQFDLNMLEAGFVHLTKEAAEQHGKALLAVNKQAIEAAS